MRSHLNRQAGGTVMGIIIGLIIGLLIAVWVAMTILKTPLPFVDKLGKQTQSTGELGDPNKSLPGGARERRERIADPEQAEAAPLTSTPTSTPSTTPAFPDAPTSIPKQVAPVVKKPAEPAPVIDIPGKPPIVERSKADKNVIVSTPAEQAAAATPAASDEKFTYYLQAGAFRELADADSTKAKLAMMGVAASVVERRSELGSLYRVRIGPFTEVEAMNRARTRLSDNGVDAAVVRMPK